MGMLFDYGVSWEQFETTVKKAGKKINRVNHISASDDGKVVGTYYSTTGNSEGSFVLDFYDCGHFTGKYTIRSSNHESAIPQKVGEYIKKELQPYVDIPRGSRFRINSIPILNNASQSTKTQTFFHKIVVLLAIVGVIALIAAGFQVVYAVSGWTPIPVMIDAGIGSSDCIGKNYEDTIDILVDSGFKRSNIEAEPIYDLNSDSKIPAGSLASIYIDGTSGFASDDEFPIGSKIMIAYHVYERINVPISASDAKGMKYYDVVSQLESAGFFNIEVEPVDDLVFGIREDSVKEISIDGLTKFDKDNEFSADSSIIIKYHTR